MDLAKLIFGVLVAICCVVVATMCVEEPTSADGVPVGHGIAHPEFETMLQGGDGTGRIQTNSISGLGVWNPVAGALREPAAVWHSQTGISWQSCRTVRDWAGCLCRRAGVAVPGILQVFLWRLRTDRFGADSDSCVALRRLAGAGDLHSGIRLPIRPLDIHRRRRKRVRRDR